MSRITSLSEWLLRQAVVWGGLGYLAFYALAVRGAAESSWLVQYFDGHPIKYATGLLFFIGLAALGIRGMRLVLEFSMVDRISLPQPDIDGDPVETTVAMMEELDTMPANLHDTYLVGRMREALQYVRRKGSADVLEAHLRHLEDVDLGRMSQGYGAVRIIVSIIPILGFLGTVLGITLAIARLDADSMEQALPAVINGLSVAFDTTALSLALSMVLLLSKYLVERLELRLLSRVDMRAGEMLLGRFRQYGSQNDPHVAAVKRMCETMLSSVASAIGEQSQAMVAAMSGVEQRVSKSLLETDARVAESLLATDERVAEALISTSQQVNTGVDVACQRMYDALETSHAQWEQMAGQTSGMLEEALAAGLTQGLETHATALAEGTDRFRDDLKQMLVRHAQILAENCEGHSQRLVDSSDRCAQVLADSSGRSAQLLAESSDRNAETIAASSDRHVEKLAEALEQHTAILAETESQLINESRRGVELLSESVERGAGGLASALETHTAVIAETETQLADENRRHLSDVEAALGEAMLVAATRQEKLIRSSEELLKEMQVALVEGAGATVAQQEQLVKQGEVLLKVVDATGHVRKLEEALNNNLQALTTSRDYEDMLVSLSATLQLLSSRLGQPLHLNRDVDPLGGDAKNRAA